ncbi:MAG TPA: hypothetical protein VGO57_11350 [Verrucomicrobiae bacterium]|jgi:hypothetical protein
MKTKIIVLMGAGMVWLFAGCASQPVSVAPVGPSSTGADHANGSGYLCVYSATQTHVIAENTYYYPHTSYTVYDDSGAVVKFVRNHTGSMDEAPALVMVPVGRYNVVAESDSYGRVTVPVVIEDGKTTVVHLDRNWSLGAKSTAVAIAKNLVHLPDGEAIGWKVN